MLQPGEGIDRQLIVGGDLHTTPPLDTVAIVVFDTRWKVESFGIRFLSAPCARGRRRALARELVHVRLSGICAWEAALVYIMC